MIRKLRRLFNAGEIRRLTIREQEIRQEIGKRKTSHRRRDGLYQELRDVRMKQVELGA